VGSWGNGSITGGGDCDDTTGNRHPNKTELCDGIDNDCNNILPNNERDLDGDGYVECTLGVAVGSWGNGSISGGDDCDNAVGSGEFTFPNAGFNEAAPLNTQCLTDEDGDGYALWESCYTLVMNDVGSNTWDGAAIGMWVDGVFFDKYSLTTNVASRTETICVNGDTIAFEFLLSATGTANDIGATITDENGATITITGHDANPDDYVTTSLGGSTHYSTGDVFHTVSPLSKGTDCDDTDEFTFPSAASVDSANECMTDVDGDNYGLIVENCFTVNMTDSGGNGWGNNYVDVYWEGVVLDTVHLASGSSGSQDVCLFSSGQIEFRFRDAGSGTSEVGGTILGLTGVSVATFSNLSNGDSLYSASVTLNVPIGLVSGTDSNDNNVSVH
jgi:hypothetical protein